MVGYDLSDPSKTKEKKVRLGFKKDAVQFGLSFD